MRPTVRDNDQPTVGATLEALEGAAIILDEIATRAMDALHTEPAIGPADRQRLVDLVANAGCDAERAVTGSREARDAYRVTLAGVREVRA